MAYVGTPYSLTNAAATSSWVERGLEAHRTRSAPPAFKVIAKFAVSVVICRQPDIRIPFKGISFAKRSRIRRKTGISLAAHSIRSLPRAANEMSLTSPRIEVVININFPSWAQFIAPLPLHCVSDPYWLPVGIKMRTIYKSSVARRYIIHGQCT